MNFSEQKAIYLQIVELIEENILSGKNQEGSRLLSVREFGVELGVNPATILRAYDELKSRSVVEQRRGVGYFVSDGAIKAVLSSHREEFIANVLPSVFKRANLLGITPEEILEMYNKCK